MKKRIRGKNIKEKAVIAMGEKNVMEKAMGYFRQYWSNNVLRKTTSLLVAVCFMVNIANLPAFADTSENLRRKRIKKEVNIESVSAGQQEEGKTLSPSQMYQVSQVSKGEAKEKIEINEEEGTVKDKETGQIATYDKKSGKVSGMTAFDNVAKLQVLFDKVTKQEGGEVVLLSEDELKEREAPVAAAREAVNEAVRPEVRETQNIEEAEGIKIGLPQENAEEEQGKEAELKTEEEIGIAVEKAAEELGEKAAETESEEYKNVVKGLAEQTGLSEEEINKALQGIERGKRDEAIGLLGQFIAKGGQIINCAADALSTVLDMASKGILAFQALIADIATGSFAENNEDLINAGETQLMTSMDAINKVLQTYGRDASGYGVSAEEFIESLGVGESGIVWVDEDHFVTVTRESEGQYSVTDANRNGGKKITYDESNIKLLMNNKEAAGKDESGKEIKSGGYKAADETGNMRVVTDAQGMRESAQAGRATVLDERTMRETAGARYETQTKTGTRTETRTATRTETRTGTRTETRTGTRTSTDKDGNTTTETYEYTVEVEYTYEVEVEYTYEVEVEYTYEVEVWVDDPEEDKKEDAEKRRAEEAEKAAEEAARLEAERKAQEALEEAARQKEAEIQRMRQEEIERQKEEGKLRETQASKTRDEQIRQENQNLTNEQFERKVKENEDTMKVTSVTVTDIKGEGISQEGKQGFISQLNDALKNIGNAVVDYGKKIAGAIVNVASKMVEGAITAAGAIKDFASNLLGIGEGKKGVVIDENNKTMTQYGMDGSRVQVNLRSGADYAQLNDIAQKDGFEAALNSTKANGSFDSMTAYDQENKEIYTATRIGYNAGQKEMAISYDFKQAYSDNIYITDAKEGDHKVVIEKINDNNTSSRAHTYSVGEGTGIEQTTESGLTFSADISSLDRVTEWVTEGDRRVAKSVDFVGGSEGKASGFEEAVVEADGSVSVTRYDVNDAYYDTKQEPQEGSGSSSQQESIVDEFKQILSDTNQLKLSGDENEGLYSGYEKVDSSWIDAGKIEQYSHNSATPNLVSMQKKDASGNDVTVTAALKGADWRYNREIDGESLANTVTIVSQGTNGGRTVTIYNEGVSIINDDFDYDVLTNNANQTTYIYDKDDNLVGGSAKYKAGTQMSTVFGGSLEGDTIELSEDANFEFTIENGTLNLVPAGAAIVGTYIQREEGSEIGRGALEKGTLTLNQDAEGNYYIGVDGKVILSSGEFNIPKGVAEETGEDSGAEGDKAKPDASDTDAVVIETEEGYRVTEGSLSLRGGSFVVMGDGAQFRTGSNLIGIGYVSEGTLLMTYDEEGNMQLTAATGECKTTSTATTEEGVSIQTDTRYDTEGVIRTWQRNGSTQAELETNYKVYNPETGKYEPVLDSNGNPSANIELKAYREGDTGFGYEVDNLGGNSPIILTVNANGDSYLTPGAQVFKLIYANTAGANAGDRIGILYEGTAEGTNSGYELRTEDRGNTALHTEDGETYYGINPVDGIIQFNFALDEEGNPLSEGEYFTVKSATGFRSITDETTGKTIYNKEVTTENEKKVLSLFVGEDGKTALGVELKEFKLDGNPKWYGVEDIISFPGGGSLIVTEGTGKDDKGNTVTYPVYVTKGEDGKYRQPPEDGRVTEVGDFKIAKVNGVWYATNYGENPINMMEAGSFSGTIGNRFTLGTIEDEKGNFKFSLRTLEDNSVTYKNPDDGTTERVTLYAGSQVALGAEGAVVMNGRIGVGKNSTIYIPPAATGTADEAPETEVGADGTANPAGPEDAVDPDADPKYPDATGTNAVIKALEGGGFSASDGDILIRDGNLVVYGKGAVFKSGSEIAGQVVKTGSLTIADFDSEGRALFVSYGDKATAAMGSISVNYNKNGVSWAGYSVTKKGNFPDSKGDVWSHSKYSVSYQITTNSGYNVLATNADGQLIVASSSRTATGTNLTDQQRQAQARARQAYNSMSEAGTKVSYLESEIKRRENLLRSEYADPSFKDYLRKEIADDRAALREAREDYTNLKLSLPSGQAYTQASADLNAYIEEMGYNDSSYGYYSMQEDSEYQRLSQAASDAYAVMNARDSLQTWQDIAARVESGDLEDTPWRSAYIEEYTNKYQQAIKDQMNMDFNGLADKAAASLGVSTEEFVENITIDDDFSVVVRGVVGAETLNSIIGDGKLVSTGYDGGYDLRIDLDGMMSAETPSGVKPDYIRYYEEHGLMAEGYVEGGVTSGFTLNGRRTEDLETITDYDGYVENIQLVFNEQNDISTTGAFDFVNTKSNAEYTERIIGELDDDNPPPPSGDSPTVNTRGVIDQSVEGQTTLSGYKSVLSFVAGENGPSAVIIGEGTTALSGSQLESAGGIVTTAGGDYTYSGGTWAAGENAGFSFNNHDLVAQRMTESFNSEGLSVSGLEGLDYEGQINGNISSNAMTMLDGIMRHSPNTAHTPAHNLSANVTGESYTFPDGVKLAQNSSFDISLQEQVNGQKALAFKTSGSANVEEASLPGDWTSDKGNIFKNIDFADGEFITIENILGKSGVSSIENTNGIWNGVDYGNITLDLVNAGYSEFGATYLALQGNGNMVSDGVERYETTALKSFHNDSDFTILAGAKVQLSSDGSLSILNANVYVDGMGIVNPPASDETANTEDADDTMESNAYFRGTALGVDGNGNIVDSSNLQNTTDVAGWDVTGVFFNYSDTADRNGFFSKGSIFADNSRLNEGSWHYNHGLVTGGSADIKMVDTDGNGEKDTEVLFSEAGYGNFVKWSEDGSRMVLELDKQGATSIRQITDGNAGGTKTVHFATELSNGYNVAQKDKEGQYVVEKIEGINYVNEKTFDNGNYNGKEERIVQRESLNGTINVTYNETTGEYSYEYPEGYDMSYTFYDNALHTEGTRANTWQTDGEQTVYTINERDGSGAITNVRAFNIGDGNLSEYTQNTSLGSQSILQSDEKLGFEFVYENGVGRVIANGTVEIGAELNGASFTAEIGYDSAKGGLYLVNSEEITTIMSNDDYTKENHAAEHLAPRLSDYATYEEYLGALAYVSNGESSYDESTGMYKYEVNEANIEAQIRDYQNGKGGENYANMTVDDYLNENGLFTRAEFEQAQRDGAIYAYEVSEEDRAITREAELKDVLFTGLFEDGLGGDPIELNYNILGSSLDSDGLGVTARLTLGSDQTMQMRGSIDASSGGAGEESSDVSVVRTRVTALVNGENIELSGDQTPGSNLKTQFDVTFNVMGDSDAVFKPEFSNFIAGTELTLRAGSSVQSNGQQKFENNGISEEYKINETVGITGGNIHFLLGKDTKLGDLAGAVISAAENGKIKGIGAEVATIKAERTITDSIDGVGNTITTNFTATYAEGTYTMPKWSDATYENNRGNGANAFGSGTFNQGENRVDYGFWSGHINVNKSELKIDKNVVAGTLQGIGGFLGSVVGVIADPFVQAANAIADLFTGEFTWEKLGNAAAKTFGAIIPVVGWTMSAVDIAQNGWNEHFSQNQILNWSASMMLDKQYDAVVRDGDAGKAAVMGIVAVAAAVFTVATGGLGVAAFIPALSAGVTLSATAIAAGAAVTAYLAGSAAFNAAAAFEKGDWKTGLLNVGAALLTIAFPVRFGGGAAATAGANAVGSSTSVVKLTGAASRIQHFLTSAGRGLVESVRSIPRLFGFGGGLTGAVRTWGTLAQHMYSMTALNVGMNTIGALFGSLGISEWGQVWSNELRRLGNGDNWFANLGSSIISAVLVDPSRTNNILSVDMGNNFGFAFVMYGTMPLIKGITSGLGGLIRGSYKVGVESAITAQSKSMMDKMKNVAKRQIEGFAEEQIKEEAIKYGMISAGIDPALAEYLAEYVDGSGGVANLTNTNYSNIVNSSDFSTDSGKSNAVNAINTMFASYGLSNITASITGNSISLSVQSADGTSSSRINSYTISSADDTSNNIGRTYNFQDLMISLASVAQTTDLKAIEAGSVNATLNSNIFAMYDAVNRSQKTFKRDTVNFIMALTASAAQNQQYAAQYANSDNNASEFTAQVAKAYAVVNANKGFNNASLMQTLSGKGIGISYQGKVNMLNIMSQYSSNQGVFDQTKIAESINNGNLQSLDDLIQLAALNEFSNETGVKISVSDVIREIKADSISNMTEVNKLALLTNLAQIGAIGTNGILNNKTNAEFAALARTFNLNETDITHINGLIDALSASVGDVSKWNSLSDMQVISNNLAVLQQFASTQTQNINVNQLNNLQQQIANRINEVRQENNIINGIYNTLQSDTVTEQDISKINEQMSGNQLSNDLKLRAAMLIMSNIRDRISISGQDVKKTNSSITSLYDSISKGDIGSYINSNELGALSQIIITQEIKTVCTTIDGYNKANEQLGKSIPGWSFRKHQEQMIMDILNGKNVGLLATVGAGKSNVTVGAAYARASMYNNANTDVIVATDALLDQYVNGFLDGENKRGSYREYLENVGVTIYDMEQLYQEAQVSKDYSEFEKALFDQNGLRIWLGNTYGFLNTNAASDMVEMDTALKNMLETFQDQNDRLTIVDEVHKFFESQTSFIQSKGDNLTLATIRNKKDTQRNDSLLRASEIASQVFSDMLAGNGEYLGLQISGTDKSGYITKDLDTKLTDIAKEKGIERSNIDSILNSLIEQYSGLEKATEATKEDGTNTVAPVSEGNIEITRVFNDFAYSYATARFTVDQDGTIQDKSHEHALEVTPVSETSMGTSGSRLFYGKGQYVGMSGTLEHVIDMSASFGMEVGQYGDMKDFSLQNVGQMYVDFRDGKKVINTESIIRQNGDNKADVVGFININGNNQDDVRNSIVQQMADQIEYNLTNGTANNPSRHQFIMSKDSKTRELLKLELERRISDRQILGVDIHEISITSTAQEIDQIKNNKDKKAQIIITSEKGATGIDYSGNYDLLVDGTGASQSLLTQTYGRVNRHTGEQSTRLLFVNQMEVDGLLQESNNPMILQGLYTQLNQSPSILDEQMKNELFDGSDINVIKLQSGILDGNIDAIKQFKLAKVYSLYKQSGQSLIFGLNDAIKDKFLTGEITRLIHNANGQSTVAGATIYNVLHGIMNKSQSSKLRVGETTESELSDGLAQMKSSLENLQQEALDAFTAIRTNLLAEGIKPNESIILEVEQMINTWNSMDAIIGNYLQQQSQGNQIDTKPITRAQTLQEAVETMLSFSDKVVASYGNQTAIENAPATTIEIISNVQQSLENNGVNVNKQQLKDLENMISDPKNSMLSVNEQLTTLGQQIVDNYKKINMKVSDDDNLARALAILLGKLLGMNFGAPEDKDIKANIMSGSVDIAQKLAYNNINVEDLASLANQGIISSDNIQYFTSEDLVRILTAKHSRGFAEAIQAKYNVMLPSAQYIETIKVIEEKKQAPLSANQTELDQNKMLNAFVLPQEQQDIYNQYNALNNYYQTNVYNNLKLTAREKAKIINDNLINTNMAYKIINDFASVMLSSLTFLPFSGLMSIANGMLGVTGQGGLTDTLKQVAAVNAVSPIRRLFASENKEQNNRRSIMELAMSGGLGILDRVSIFRNNYNLGNTAKQFDSINSKLSENKTSEQIKTRMAIAGIETNAETNHAIENAVWMQTNMPEVYNNMKLSDIAGLERLTGVIEIAKADKDFTIGLDYESLKPIISGQRTVVEMLDPVLAEKLKLAEFSIPGILENQTVVNNAKLKDVEAISQELGLDRGYVMALLLPTKKPADMINRYNNSLKDTLYADRIMIGDLGKDINFENSGISSALKKTVAGRTSYGEVATNKERQALAGESMNTAKGRLDTMIRNLGGSELAGAFVRGLSIGALTDRKFAKELERLTRKTTRDAIGIRASDIYGAADKEGKVTVNQALVNKINNIYASGVGVSGLQEVIEGYKVSESAQRQEQTQQQPVQSNVIPFVNCVQASVEAFGVNYDPSKTVGDYALDFLQAAGIAERSIEIASGLLGTARANLNGEYATIDENSNISSKVSAYYINNEGKGHLATVDSWSALKAEEQNGFKFTGIVIATREAITDTNNGIRAVYNEEAGKVFGTNINEEGQELEGVIVNGITKPADINVSLAALLAICTDTNKVAEMLGFKDFADASNNKETIVQQYYARVGQVLGLSDEEAGNADKQVAINLLAMARDVMFMAANNPQAKALIDSPNMKVEEIMPMFVVSKAVNQNVITEDMMKANNVAVDNNEDFVIDVEKLQNAVKEKISARNAKDALEDLASIFNKGERGRTDLMPIALKLSDIRAVAASA